MFSEILSGAAAVAVGALSLNCVISRILQVLEEAVNTRIEANAFESRSDNKMWLVRHLEVRARWKPVRLTRSCCGAVAEETICTNAGCAWWPPASS